jgi:hypothetical protein
VSRALALPSATLGKEYTLKKPSAKRPLSSFVEWAEPKKYVKIGEKIKFF